MIDNKIMEAYKEMKKDVARHSKEEYRDILVNHLLATLGWLDDTSVSELSDEANFLAQIIELFCIDKIYQLDHTDDNK